MNNRPDLNLDVNLAPPMYERRKHKCEKNNGELICLSCSTPFEGLFFKCFSAALDKLTGQYSRCDRTTSIITEAGTYTEHFLKIAMPFPILETMKYQTKTGGNLVFSDLFSWNPIFGQVKCLDITKSNLTTEYHMFKSLQKQSQIQSCRFYFKFLEHLCCVVL